MREKTREAMKRLRRRKGGCRLETEDAEGWTFNNH